MFITIQIKNLKKQSQSIPRSRWISSAIINCSDTKDIILYPIWQAYSRNENNNTEYTKYEKIVDKEIKDDKLTYDQE